ncbi:MAG: perosamine synthetase [Thiomicrorhabdus sp.]|nr:MAG: perosamine synthetase [Thiomicrorhabdus sp.]
MFDPIMQAVRQVYGNGFVPLHVPCFSQLEKDHLNACIDSTFVSSVGKFVDQFEDEVAAFTGAKHAVAVVNGTLGLFLGLRVVGVQANDLVLTQSLTFVATPNAIKMLGAEPVFLDVSTETLGLSYDSLQLFLETQTRQDNNCCVHKITGQTVSACMPMHTLGMPAEIDRIVELCHSHNIKVVEDAAESLGSYWKGQHTGTFGDVGVFSFNGNKILTTGGGGMLVTNNAALADKAKHLSTTAKMPHAWLFEHDEIGYNLRMPNLNAALGVAQMAKLPEFLTKKRQIAESYQQALSNQTGLKVLQESLFAKSNYWLNAVLFENPTDRDTFLAESNALNIQTRPLWRPMHQLEIYQNCLRTELPNTEYLASRLVNIPSGVKCHA